MELSFAVVKEVGIGSYPDVLHFDDTTSQVFYINGGLMEGLPSDKITMGEWENIVFQEAVDISPNSNITNFEINKLQGFGAVGTYKTDNMHKLLIYEFAFEMDRYLSSANIKHSIDNPISSFSLSLENPKNPNPEYEGNVAISEESSLISPGSKISFEFSIGDSEYYPMGIFYVDRSSFSLLNETINVDGRNIIGKALNDQTYDEENIYGYNIIHQILKDILLKANISPDEILIENTLVYAGYQFDVTMSYLEGIMEILKALNDWQIKELVDGTVVVGSTEYDGFTKNSSYIFQRDKDIFTRNIIRDDQEVYRRVCIHNRDYSILIYQDVETYSGWNLQANKTLYINVPDGTSLEDAQTYAIQIANSLQYVGKIESFTGPFRPQIILGDEATIVSNKGIVSLGLITEITHRFGKEGFYTEFTVDSGGILGKGRLSDYIGKITKDKASSNRVYE